MKILIAVEVTDEDRYAIGHGQLASKRECFDELNFITKKWLAMGRCPPGKKSVTRSKKKRKANA